VNLTYDEAEATRLDEENEADRKASIERARARASKEGAAA
jgi:multiple sugar transport system ATP-binding protein